MGENYDGIKYYSSTDLTCGLSLQKAESKVLSCPPEVVADINQAIELYNIKLFFDNGSYLSTWSQTEIENYKNLVKQFDGTVATFFSTINESNIEDIISHVDIDYIEDFWSLFSKY